MIPVAFQYHAPTTLDEAIAILRRYLGEAKCLAGGQSLIPMMKLRLVAPSHLVDLRRIQDLAHVHEHDGGLAIGSMMTYYQVQTSPLVRQRLPVLVEATNLIADVQVRNTGTIGGAVAHADPAADVPALLLACEAQVYTVGGAKDRRIAADRLFRDAFTTALTPAEIITEIRIPALPPLTGGSYQKFAHKASHFAIVGVAALVTLDDRGVCQRVRIGVTGAGYKPTRARAAERYLEEKAPSKGNIEAAAKRALRGVEFLDDHRGSAEYREHLTHVLVARALAEAAARASGTS